MPARYEIRCTTDAHSLGRPPELQPSKSLHSAGQEHACCAFNRANRGSAQNAKPLRKLAMDVSQLPFNRLIGLEPADSAGGGLVRLPGDSRYSNHLGTVHASALLAVAEAGSGAFLAQRLGNAEGFIPVVRKMEAKFRKPATGSVSARCMAGPAEVSRWSDELAARGRISVSVPMEVVDSAGVVAMSATVEWFITKSKLS